MAVEERGIHFELKSKLRTALNRELNKHQNRLLWALCEKTTVEQQKFLGSVLSEIVRS